MQATRQSDPERWVKAIRYEDRWSLADERIVSPIRFIARDAVLALCLGRESPRRFSFDGIKEVRLMAAHEAVMPSPVTMVPFGKRPKRLPTVLSRQEVDELLRCIENLKHRTFFSTLYACGMRISEVAHWQVHALVPGGGPSS